MIDMHANRCNLGCMELCQLPARPKNIPFLPSQLLLHCPPFALMPPPHPDLTLIPFRPHHLRPSHRALSPLGIPPQQQRPTAHPITDSSPLNLHPPPLGIPPQKQCPTA